MFRCSFLILFSFLLISPPANAVVSKKMSYKKWKKIVAHKAPQKMCAKQSILRSCYGLSKKKCTNNIKKYMPRCLSKLPSKKKYVVLPKEGSKLGFSLGACVYRQVASHTKDFKEKRKAKCELF